MDTEAEKLFTRDEYTMWLKEYYPSNTCSFCKDQGMLIIKKGKSWILLIAKAPYWKYHFLLVPNRHLLDFSEMNDAELNEFVRLYKFTLKKLKKAKLKYKDGTPVTRFLFFWRHREGNYDPIIDATKTDHFHFHVVPEKEHLIDPILDKEAVMVDLREAKSIFVD